MTSRVILQGTVEWQRAREQSLLSLSLRSPTSDYAEGMSGLTGILPSTICSAGIRSSLWALSNGGEKPVHVGKLLNATQRLVTHLLVSEPGYHFEDQDVSSYLEETLEEMELLGDVARLPHGFWLPAPLRCVPLRAAGTWLLVGGMPSALLPNVLSTSVAAKACARFIDTDPLDSGLPVQTEEAWRESPRKGLQEWTTEVLSSCPLLPWEDFETDKGSIEVYLPDLMKHGSRGNLQYYRWTPLGTVPRDGRYLARIRTRLSQCSYHFLIVETHSGKVESSGSLDLREGDLRRLLYGLDQRAGSPVTVRTWQDSSSQWFELRNELPSSEYRLFVALGREHSPMNGRYYPRIWEIPLSLGSQAEAALSGLGVILDNHGRPPGGD